MRCERTLRTATLLVWGAGLLLARPARAEEILAPANWVGAWDFVVTYRSSDTGMVVGMDKMSNDICPGQPVGLALFDRVPMCQSTATDTDLSVHCATEMEAGTCHLKASLQVGLQQTGATIEGAGEWTASTTADCLIPGIGTGQTIEIVGQRRAAQPASGCAKPSTLVEKFVAQPLAMMMSDLPFASIGVDPIEAEGGTFDVEGAFALAAGSDGIDPRTEALRLQVGTFKTTIPAGSFRLKAARGKTPAEYTYDAPGRARLQMKITRLAAGRFTFEAHAERTSLRRTKEMVPVVLAVGNDTGTVAAKTRRPHEHDDGCDRDDHDHDDHDHDDHDGHGRRGE